MQNTSSLPDLSALKTVHVVGPKPHALRALFNYTAGAVATMALGALIATSIHAIKHEFFEEPTPSLAAPRSLQSSVVMPYTNAWLQAMRGRSEIDLEFYDDGKPHVVNTISYEDAAVVFDEMNLTADQQLDVFLHLKAASSAFVFGADQPALKKEFADLKASSQQWLNQAWNTDPAQWDRVLGSSQDRRRSVLFFAPANVRDGSWETLPEADKLDYVKEFWTALSFSFLRNPAAGIPLAGKGDLSQSYSDLQQVVSQAGLAALIVPFAYQDDPYLVASLAHEVSSVNAELSKQVGWSSKSMGLNYRIVLDHSALERSAFAKQDQEAGWVFIQSHWATFSHEWFHALQTTLTADDVSMQEDKVDAVLSGVKAPSLSEEHRLQIQAYASDVMEQRTTISTPMFQALQNVDNQVARSGGAAHGSWVVWRQQAANELKSISPEKSGYLMYDQEILATSFASFVALDSFQSSRPSFLRDRKLWAGSSVSYDPTYPETNVIEPVWKNFFTQLGPWWELDSATRQPSSIKEKVISRRVPEQPPTPTPAP